MPNDNGRTEFESEQITDILEEPVRKFYEPTENDKGIDAIHRQAYRPVAGLSRSKLHGRMAQI